MITANDMYASHLRYVMQYGESVTARGLKFKEVTGIVYRVSMADPIVTLSARQMGYAFAVAEPFWILSGSNLLSEISPYGKMAPYSDDGYFMRGAYGPKITDQLPYICRTLAEDQGSRQAVLTIWRERPEKSKDVSCTIAMQFMIRNGKLDCFTFMRSSDAILGLPYDSIMFSLTSAYVLSILKHYHGCEGVELGDLSLFIGSAHIYDKDLELAKQIVSDPSIDTLNTLDFNRIAKRSPSDFITCLGAARLSSKGILIVAGGEHGHSAK